MVYSLPGVFFCLAVSFLLACLAPGNNFFSAPLVMCMYNAPLSLFLTCSFICGALQDCLLLSQRFGFVAISFVLTARMLYPARLYFFKDALSTLPIMTFLFSSISALISALVALFFECDLPFRPLVGFFIQPFYDVLYAMLIFVLLPFVFSRYRMILRKRKS
jgi:hypothetical protein